VSDVETVEAQAPTTTMRRVFAAPTIGTAGRLASASVLSAFAPTDPVAYVARAGTTYQLLLHIGDGRLWRVSLEQLTGLLGGHLVNQLRRNAFVLPMTSVDDTDAAIAKTGTWVGPNNNAGAYGGSYQYSTVAGSTVAYTFPAGRTAVGCRYVAAVNAGLAKVTVDGSDTAATLLPTAQALVDAGLYASSILVANGGTLDPADRVLDQFATVTDYDARVVVADGLDGSAHELVLTCTGYQRASGATGGRTYISGFSSSGAGIAPTDANVVLAESHLFGWVTSAWEFAIEAKPTGASDWHFLGNVHGYEIQDSLTVAVDGATATLADGDIVAASDKVTVTRVSRLYHPDLGAGTTVADATVVYRMDGDGLTVEPAITWRVGGSVRSSYIMMALNGAEISAGIGMDRGEILGDPTGARTFDGDSGDVYYGAIKSPTAWLWNQAGDVGAVLHVPDVWQSTFGWANTGTFTRIEDREGSITKVYVAQVDASAANRAVTVGQVWRWNVRYLAGYFPDGAEATLASLP
jgi:hypothetical protein